MNQAQCAEKYGAIVNGVWAEEEDHCVLLELPPLVKMKVFNTANGGPWARIYCNQDMAKPLLQALDSVCRKGLLSELDTFDGCFMIRNIRLGADLSAHSWAMALDLNAKQNPLGGTPTFSPEFVQCFKDAGFAWGGDFARKDGMHFSLAGF